MRITLAFKTMQAIEECVKRDQGNAFRGHLKRVMPHIGDAYREDEEPFRAHLGSSILGQDCARYIYMSHRWCTQSDAPGYMIRLWNRGHMEEGRFIALMLTIGCQVYQQDEKGKQFRISFADGHGGGSGDGVIVGIPDLAPGQPALGEFKTHNQKSFDKLAGTNWRKFITGEHGEQFTGDGVKETKPEHYVQMQTYMEKMGIAVALYTAVNKNTDDIYCELVTLDSVYAQQYFDRGTSIAFSSTPPKRISESPGYWKCRYCDHKAVCQLGKAPAVNCRTCVFSHPVQGEPGGQWRCNAYSKILSREEQLKGCPGYAPRTDFGAK